MINSHKIIFFHLTEKKENILHESVFNENLRKLEDELKSGFHVNVKDKHGIHT